MESDVPHMTLRLVGRGYVRQEIVLLEEGSFEMVVVVQRPAAYTGPPTDSHDLLRVIGANRAIAQQRPG